MISRPSSSLAVMIDSLCVVFNQIASINQFAINAPCDTGFRQTWTKCPAQHPWGLQRGRNGVGCHQEEL